jgi:hypothetical protein
MRSRPRHFVVTLALVCVLAPPAQAVTLHDIVALTKAGLSDDIIIALLEADPTIFSLDAQKLMELRNEGVSERVLIEMLRSGREPLPLAVEIAAPAAEPAVADPAMQPPQVVVIDHQQPAPLYVPYPVFVATGAPVARPRVGPPTEGKLGFGRFINDGTRREPAATTHEAKPVYWGWGGKRRPDTWPEDRKP